MYKVHVPLHTMVLVYWCFDLLLDRNETTRIWKRFCRCVCVWVFALKELHNLSLIILPIGWYELWIFTGEFLKNWTSNCFQIYWTIFACAVLCGNIENFPECSISWCESKERFLCALCGIEKRNGSTSARQNDQLAMQRLVK